MSLKKSPSLFFWFSISTRWHVWGWKAAPAAVNLGWCRCWRCRQCRFSGWKLTWQFFAGTIFDGVDLPVEACCNLGFNLGNNTLGGAEVPDIRALREAQGQRVVVAMWQSQVGRQLAPRVGRHYWGFIQDFFRDGVVMINVGYRLVWAGPPPKQILDTE